MVGVCGNEKDSDVLVTVDLNVTGIEVIIESKLKKMFGKLMEKAVREVLSEMKVENAKVLVQDFGALDFVIKGRTRTAVRRAMAGKEVK
ncbi:MAG: citrate lyase acyl carrier protein [Fusobacterium mortiferum]|jgi:citrate lyase subunit gamma (acyl carrier protein)|uniref:Citrate lyase acyl carrier protein n=1 Tax=Fusobacterium mortiferum TaxID=850 RepID=A0A414PTZ6_FUSMR|nr:MULTISPECIES: citrate lyase acyl carrier protein [Fusobacterium]MCF2700258.1 citrate lyase acyl carrier protein [Fusobacterium mortiferum]MCI7188429.1 citrate lyase acyl carrier protein [Fusobacterium mortiferum]MCI7666069.1 citrate lyase acyl carrier protein [Fusobacterium mortiferum]MDD7263285.1 citrate lyase acyl carrier protein [Fusobacterium mortiferum]MDY2800210.1 citrate lyase acyl carrier protein [Fusobacterium mortiferum]